MPQISNSAAKVVDLQENRGATLARRVTAKNLVSLTGYTPFVTIGGVSVTTATTDNYFEFHAATSGLAHGVPYQIGWTDPDGNIEVLCTGRVLLV
jgi:hypothetical protein